MKFLDDGVHKRHSRILLQSAQAQEKKRRIVSVASVVRS
jgi:hypothetical protein